MIRSPDQCGRIPNDADELHEHAAESIRHVNDQPVFVPAEIEDHSVVANEIDGVAELPLYLSRVAS
jgi:hypothetical protein